MVRKALFALPALALAAVALLGPGGTNGASAASTINVLAGDGEKGYAINLFLDDVVYIQPGDTVKWVWGWFEPHTVTFGQPTGDPTAPTGGANPSYDGTGFISSGLLFGDDKNGITYSVTFPESGSFKYFCVIHPFMTGTVVVQTPDLGVPDNQASVDARGAADAATAITNLKALAAASAAKPVAVSPQAGGGKKYTLQISSSTDSTYGDVQQFFPSSASIGVNDTVEWISNVHTPHTITIGTPAEVGAFAGAQPSPDPTTWPVRVPAGAKYDGSGGILHSGTLGIDWKDGTKFSLTFTKAGTYNYFCILHADQGMVAEIKVGAATAPGAPGTGNSIAPPSGRSGLWLIAGAIALLTAATAGAFAAGRR